MAQNKLTNNDYILSKIVDYFEFSSEQLEADKMIKWKDSKSYLEELKFLLLLRLNAGAKKYQKEVPIFDSELNGRDNLQECIEEIADASVYATAEKIRLLDYKDNKVIQVLIKRLLTNLSYSYLLANELRKEMKKINKNGGSENGYK